jgi:tetratricopeptide (TPR) repeat protein
MPRFYLITACSVTLCAVFCSLPAGSQTGPERRADPAKAKDVPNPAIGRFDFSDEIHFTVAGVADTTNLGGHGSSVAVVANKEAVAEAAASLGKRPGDLATDPSSSLTEKSLREAASSDPASFNASYRLGKWLVDQAKTQEGIQYLKRADSLRPSDYENRYELALAYAKNGDYGSAREIVQSLLIAPAEAPERSAELHHLLAEVEEQSGNPLEAVREYERAAKLNPSEANLFSWGAELLIHHAPAPAIEVFSEGNRLFPLSVRMLAGLGAGWYALGSYDQALQRLCQASELNPNDPNPYLLIGKIQEVGTEESSCASGALMRFSKLEPDNALANYYYGVNLWKRQNSTESAQDLPLVKSSLEKAVRLDPNLGSAYLQLGIIYAEQKDLSKAIAVYRKAIQATPSLEQAHYRLARAYTLSGDPAKAHAELQLYEQISKEKERNIKRQHREVQQFVYQLRDGAPSVKQ